MYLLVQVSGRVSVARFGSRSFVYLISLSSLKPYFDGGWSWVPTVLQVGYVTSVLPGSPDIRYTGVRAGTGAVRSRGSR